MPRGALSIPTKRFRRLLRLDQNPALAAENLHDLLPADTVTDLEHMFRKADRMGSTTSQMDIVTRA